ncbi:YkuS family protein [Anaeromicrobium sediminis]|nr:YkuS family protein [Anaeromicrobium sediminis]
MDKKVVVENTLKPYIDILEESGYDVHKLYKNENANKIESTKYDGVVVSSAKNIPMGHNSKINVPIIEAEGKTPEEVLNILISTHHDGMR